MLRVIIESTKSVVSLILQHVKSTTHKNRELNTWKHKNILYYKFTDNFKQQVFGIGLELHVNAWKKKGALVKICLRKEKSNLDRLNGFFFFFITRAFLRRKSCHRYRRRVITTLKPIEGIVSLRARLSAVRRKKNRRQQDETAGRREIEFTWINFLATVRQNM